MNPIAIIKMDDNYNNHGFYQIQDKCPQRTSDTLGLIEYLVAFHSCRQAFGFQLFKFCSTRLPTLIISASEEAATMIPMAR